MRFTLFHVALLSGLFSGCQQSKKHKLSSDATSLSVASSSTITEPWVSYSADDLPLDTSLFAQPQQVGIMADPSLVESSGVASSRRNPGYIWTEEDSGNSNQIQLLRQDGTIVARLTIDGAENNDWEDIAVGPGPVPGESYIYLAEIGDNKLQYPEKVIYRFPEPALAGQKLPYDGHIAGVDVLRLQLPDGPENAEAILVDPATKDLFILSKDDQSNVYRATFPQSLTQATTMTRLLILPFKKVTSAAVSPDGREILIRTYKRLFYYKRQAGETITDALKRTPTLVPLANEPQGEAVGWAIDGSGYYTGSEKVGLSPEPINWYARKK